MSMLVGVAVGLELAHVLDNTDKGDDRGMDIRFLGHAAFELSDGNVNVLIDPFLTGNPKAAASADEVERRRDPAHPRPRRPLSATPSTSPSAPAPPCVAIVELAGEIGEAGRRDVRDPNLGGTVDVRLGLGQARPRLAHLDDAERHGQHARRPA